jgi:cytochrome c peroxidase
VQQAATCRLRIARESCVRWVLLSIAASSALAGCGGGGYRSGPQTKAYLQPIPPITAAASPKTLQQTGLPVEATAAAIPRDNPQTAAKVALGQKLFFEGRLSADGTVACSSCHDPAHGYTDGRPVSIGIKGRLGQRNAPTILNALYNTAQFWDGRATTLEEQAAFPIVNPSEMGQSNLDAAVTRIANVREYRKSFDTAFGRAPNVTDLLRAIASFERTQLAFDSPFDHFIAGEQKAISASAKRGWTLFNSRGRCTQCHALTRGKPDVTNFSDHGFHNIGVVRVRVETVAMARQADQVVPSADKGAIDRTAIQSDMSVLGRFLVTRQDSDIGAFKTPNLRNLLMTAPYFHDGSHPTLWDVIDHYNKGGDSNDLFLDKDIQPLALQEKDIDDLVAFLASLTSTQFEKPATEEFARQRKLSRSSRPYRDIARAFGRTGQKQN